MTLSDPLPTGREPFTDRLAVRLADFVVRWRWLVLLASLVVVGAATAGLTRLEFVNDYRIFFSDENPELIAFNRFQDTYTNNDNVIFVLKPRTGDVFSRDTLAAVEALTEAAWTIPYVIRVDSVTNFQHSRAEGNQLIVADLVRDAASLTDEELAERRDIALAEPILNGYLITPDFNTESRSISVEASSAMRRNFSTRFAGCIPPRAATCHKTSGGVERISSGSRPTCSRRADIAFRRFSSFTR